MSTYYDSLQEKGAWGDSDPRSKILEVMWLRGLNGDKWALALSSSRDTESLS